MAQTTKKNKQKSGIELCTASAAEERRAGEATAWKAISKTPVHSKHAVRQQLSRATPQYTTNQEEVHLLSIEEHNMRIREGKGSKRKGEHAGRVMCAGRE